MPTEAALFGFIEDAGVLFEFFKHLGAFAAELLGLRAQVVDEGGDGGEAFAAEVPLGRGKAFYELLVPCSLLDEFSSAEKNSMSGRTPRESASFSTASSWRASALPFTKMSKPGSSPSTTMYMEAAIP